jgi:hypothetical protein
MNGQFTNRLQVEELVVNPGANSETVAPVGWEDMRFIMFNFNKLKRFDMRNAYTSRERDADGRGAHVSGNAGLFVPELEFLALPENMEEVLWGAFTTANNPNLVEVILPSSLTVISRDAFFNTSIRKITFLSPTPPVLGPSALPTTTPGLIISAPGGATGSYAGILATLNSPIVNNLAKVLSATADGSATTVSTKITIVFDRAVPSADFTISSGGGAATKGAVTSSSGNIVYTIDITGVTNGNVYVSASAAGYDFSGFPATVTLHGASAGPLAPAAITLPLQADGTVNTVWTVTNLSGDVLQAREVGTRPPAFTAAGLTVSVTTDYKLHFTSSGARVVTPGPWTIPATLSNGTISADTYLNVRVNTGGGTPIPASRVVTTPNSWTGYLRGTTNAYGAKYYTFEIYIPILMSPSEWAQLVGVPTVLAYQGAYILSDVSAEFITDGGGYYIRLVGFSQQPDNVTFRNISYTIGGQPYTEDMTVRLSDANLQRTGGDGGGGGCSAGAAGFAALVLLSAVKLYPRRKP